MSASRPPGVAEWAWRAAGDLMREIDRIGAEADQVGQVEQSDVAHDYAWMSEAAKIIMRHSRGR